jgi:hypothetical protein
MKTLILYLGLLVCLVSKVQAQAAITPLGGGVGTPYAKTYFIESQVKTKDTKLGKVNILNVYYGFFSDGKKIINGEEAWGKVDTVLILCNPELKSKPIVTLNISYVTGLVDGKTLSSQKFDVNDENVDSSRRALDKDIEQRLYGLVCR